MSDEHAQCLPPKTTMVPRRRSRAKIPGRRQLIAGTSRRLELVEIQVLFWTCTKITFAFFTRELPTQYILFPVEVDPQSDEVDRSNGIDPGCWGHKCWQNRRIQLSSNTHAKGEIEVASVYASSKRTSEAPLRLMKVQVREPYGRPARRKHLDHSAQSISRIKLQRDVAADLGSHRSSTFLEYIILPPQVCELPAGLTRGSDSNVRYSMAFFC